MVERLKEAKLIIIILLCYDGANEIWVFHLFWPFRLNGLVYNIGISYGVYVG